MADEEKMQGAISDALVHLAEKMKEPTASSHSLELASAVRELAEAWAWIERPSNEH